MLINGWPRLACKTFVNDLIKNKTNTIIIEPLSKFPIVNDLIIDRELMYDNIKKAQQWLEEDANINNDNLEFEYEVSQCLMCGCCLEACPNYNGEDEYYGTILPVSSSKISKQETDTDKLKFLKENYKKHFYNSCVKSLVCEDVCPMNIQTQRAISIMNRYSVWKFHKLLKL
jgi:succinate dehydrogenase / fumarate reductase iron-sulfur subunit